jgi:hypothetical protein
MFKSFFPRCTPFNSHTQTSMHCKHIYIYISPFCESIPSPDQVPFITYSDFYTESKSFRFRRRRRLINRNAESIPKASKVHMDDHYCWEMRF